MKRLLLTLSICSLAACAPVQKPAEITTSDMALQIVPETLSIQGEGDACGVKTTLGLLGAVTDSIQVDESMGACAAKSSWLTQLQVPEASTTMIAYEHYYAGGGFQIAVRLEGGFVIIDKRETFEGSGDEAGGCGEWKQLARYAVPKNVKVESDTVTAVAMPVIGGCSWR